MGRTLGLGLGQSHFGNNTRFGTGLVTLWEEHSVLDWASHKNTRFGTGLVTLWEEHKLRVFENEAGENIRAKEGASDRRLEKTA